MIVHEPVLQDQVPRQSMRDLAPLEGVDRLVGQTRLLHPVVEPIDLDGEGRRALADVVDAGDPGGEEPELVRRSQPRRRIREFAFNEVASSGRQPMRGEVLGHRGGVEQVQPERKPAAPLRVIAGLGPRGARAW